MSNIKQLQDQKAELAAELRVVKSQRLNLLKAAEKNPDGKLSEDQERDLERIKSAQADVEGRIEANARSLEIAESRQQLERELAGKETPDDPNTAADAAARGVTAKARWEDDPKFGFGSPRDFLAAVVQVSTGREAKVKPDHRAALKKLWAAAGSDEQSTFADPYGGFAVPTAFVPNLLTVQAEGDPTAGRTTMIPMASPKVEIPARTDKNHTTSVSGGLRVRRRAEGDQAASSRMEMEKVTLNANSLLGVAYATEELLSDSAISFAAMLEAGFRDEFMAKVLDEKLNGTGVGQMTGVITAACTVSIAKETNQVAATIVYDNILKMRARCWRYGQAIWLANHDTLPQLAKLNQEVGTGGAIVWQPSAREDVPETLLGRPIFFTEFCPTLGTVGDLLLGNWSQYLEGTYQSPQSAESLHVRFENHERAFKFFMRNDGSPWWKSALTPRKGSNKLSPFVTLATRS